MSRTITQKGTHTHAYFISQRLSPAKWLDRQNHEADPKQHRAGHQLDWVNVNPLRLAPCLSCLKCRPNGECILPVDDGHRVARKIRQADALILGSPTYFGNITGPLKTLIDRSLTAFEEIAASGREMPTPLHTGKKAAIVTACNISEPLSNLPTQGAGTLAALEIVINAGGFELVGRIMVDGAAALTELPESVIDQAKEISQKLVHFN